jgi:hypothetical protein
MYEAELLTSPTDPILQEHDQERVPRYRRKMDTVVGQQLLINYCFSHDASTILLCPYGAGINTINHSSDLTKVNVRVQWAPSTSSDDTTITPNHDTGFLKRTPPSMEWVYETKLMMEYVAIKDIGVGEELFLDYGPSWQQAWDKHVLDWSTTRQHQRQQDKGMLGYLSALQYNLMYGDDTIIRTDSEQGLDPYPENLSLHCHSSVVYTDVVDGVETDWDKTDWTWHTHDKGYPCVVLKRQQYDDGNSSSYAMVYVVNVTFIDEEDDDDELVEQTFVNVPRQALRFVDKPYTTDLHQKGVFRHPIGIPDDILPQAWKNRIVSQEAESSPPSPSLSRPNVDSNGSDIEPQPGCRAQDSDIVEEGIEQASPV